MIDCQDLFSYNVEQARRDSHNMIAVFMHRQDLGLQEAVDAVGVLCKASIDRFEQDRRLLPSWGSEIDRDVATYVQGLQNWIVGSLHWSFESTRYFGKDGMSVKKHRLVKLLPKHDDRRKSLSVCSVAAQSFAPGPVCQVDFLPARSPRPDGRADWGKGACPGVFRLLSRSRRAFSSVQLHCRPSNLPLV